MNRREFGSIVLRLITVFPFLRFLVPLETDCVLWVKQTCKPWHIGTPDCFDDPYGINAAFAAAGRGCVVHIVGAVRGPGRDVTITLDKKGTTFASDGIEITEPPGMQIRDCKFGTSGGGVNI